MIGGIKNRIEIYKNIFYYRFKKVDTTQSHDIWRNLTETEITNYTKNESVSKHLLELINKTKIQNSDSILELGCNVGRNLNYLSKHNFNNMSAIEINSNAIKLMKKFYPRLNANITIDSFENGLKQFPDDEFSLVYSTAVLMHVNRDSDFIFKEIKRITKKYVIIIERENYNYPPKHFSRNYNHIFTELNFNELYSEEVKIPNLPNGFISRVFEKV